MSVCLIHNPTAGRARSGRRLRRFLASLPPSVVLRGTTRDGHARELALAATLEGFATVSAAGLIDVRDGGRYVRILLRESCAKRLGVCQNHAGGRPLCVTRAGRYVGRLAGSLPRFTEAVGGERQ